MTPRTHEIGEARSFAGGVVVRVVRAGWFRPDAGGFFGVEIKCRDQSGHRSVANFNLLGSGKSIEFAPVPVEMAFVIAVSSSAL